MELMLLNSLVHYLMMLPFTHGIRGQSLKAEQCSHPVLDLFLHRLLHGGFGLRPGGLTAQPTGLCQAHEKHP
eukprot:1156849-Pelagomonas_calceolata.AAC.3